MKYDANRLGNGKKTMTAEQIEQYVEENAGTEYTAGEGISIVDNVISATGIDEEWKLVKTIDELKALWSLNATNDMVVLKDFIIYEYYHHTYDKFIKGQYISSLYSRPYEISITGGKLWIYTFNIYEILRRSNLSSSGNTSKIYTIDSEGTISTVDLSGSIVTDENARLGIKIFYKD